MRGELEGTVAQTLEPNCAADSKSQSAGGQLCISQESLLIFFFGAMKQTCRVYNVDIVV